MVVAEWEGGREIRNSFKFLVFGISYIVVLPKANNFEKDFVSQNRM